MKLTLLAGALACLAGCASHHVRPAPVLLIAGLGDGPWSPGIVELAEARGLPVMTYHGEHEGRPVAIVGHSLGADRAVREAGDLCPAILILIDPTEPADLSHCERVHLIRSGWDRRPEIAGAQIHEYPASTHEGVTVEALPLIDELLKGAGL